MMVGHRCRRQKLCGTAEALTLLRLLTLSAVPPRRQPSCTLLLADHAVRVAVQLPSLLPLAVISFSRQRDGDGLTLAPCQWWVPPVR